MTCVHSLTVDDNGVWYTLGGLCPLVAGEANSSHSQNVSSQKDEKDSGLMQRGSQIYSSSLRVDTVAGREAKAEQVADRKV